MFGHNVLLDSARVGTRETVRILAMPPGVYAVAAFHYFRSHPYSDTASFWKAGRVGGKSENAYKRRSIRNRAREETTNLQMKNAHRPVFDRFLRCAFFSDRCATL